MIKKVIQSSEALRSFHRDMRTTYFIAPFMWLVLMFVIMYVEQDILKHMLIASCVWLTFICWKQLELILVSTYANGVRDGQEDEC